MSAKCTKNKNKNKKTERKIKIKANEINTHKNSNKCQEVEIITKKDMEGGVLKEKKKTKRTTMAANTTRHNSHRL